MTLSINHSTAADSSFTVAGATAWNNAHSLSGTLPIDSGGTGETTAAAAITALAGTQVSGRYLRSDGTNTALAVIVAADVPTLNQNTTGTAANVTGTVAVANGGTGTATPALVAGTNVTITGTWPNQTINSTSSGGSGTVTSVSATVPAFLSIAGSPITTSGTLAITYSGTALPIVNGGTGQTTASAAFNALSPVTSTGDLIIGNGTNSATRLPIGANTYVLTSNGTTATWAAGGGGGSSAYTRTTFTATAGQTAFTVTYAVGYLQIYVNGVLLTGSDYTATSGTGFTLNVACSVGDIVEALVITTSVTGVTTGKAIAMAMIFGY